MDIQLASDIKDLLMEDGMVILPGLGGFTSTYKPAVTDGVMGVLHPPSYHLAFDSNQQVNDGKLVEYIREKYHVSSTVAQEAIEAFVKETQSQFDKNEIAILPEIGRLYRDFTQKIQFLPEATNFNANTFGLSSINFSPISRTKTEPVRAMPVELVNVETSPAIASAVEPKPLYKEKVEVAFLTPIDDVPPPSIIEKPKKGEWLPANWRNYAPAFAVALFVIFAVLVWMNTGEPSNTEGGKKLENDKPKVNVSPHNNTSSTASTDVMSNNSAPQLPNLPPQNPADSTNVTNNQFFEDKKKQETITATKPEVYPTKLTNKAIIIIGGFANKSNIIRLKKWITEQGYVVYEKKKSGGITEVGCEIGYETKAELNGIVKKIKARYGDEIEVYKK